MSGSNYGDANSTLTLVVNNIEINNCESCIRLIISYIKEIEGVESVTRGEKQLTIVQKLHPDKIRKNNNFSKPHNMAAVVGINVDCYGCMKNTREIFSTTAGLQAMDEMENKLFALRGAVAINPLAKRLEKKLRKFVKIISIKIECGGAASGSGGGGGDARFRCANSNCPNNLPKVEEILKTVDGFLVDK